PISLGSTVTDGADADTPIAYAWNVTASNGQQVVAATAPLITNSGGQGYTGLDFNQSTGLWPPDTSGAAGPSNYVETVNQTLVIYNPKGTGATQVSDNFLHFFFTAGALTRADGGSSLSNPIVTYDELAGRFIV